MNEAGMPAAATRPPAGAAADAAPT